MKFLLDTCTFLWMLGDDTRLGADARDVILDPDNRLHLSAASSWEIVIKVGLRKLRLPEPPEKLIPVQMRRNAIASLAVEHSHALATRRLPLHHRDPFDRLLVAQAQQERMVMVTPDRAFAAYDIRTIW